MCCIPLRCLQCLVITVAVVLIAVGACVIAAAAYSRNNEFFLYVGDGTAVFAVGLTFGIVLILICIIGIWGACKRNRCCLLIFGIVNFCVMIVLIALTVVVFILRDNYSDYYEYFDCTSNNSHITDLKTAQSLASQSLCKESCKCGYNYDAITGMIKEDGGPTAFQGCDNFNNDYQGEAALIGAVELLFNCHGICNQDGTLDIYYFSNINNNNGKAGSTSCEVEVWHFIKNSTAVVGGIVCAMAVITFLAFIALCSLCCHPQKQDYWDASDRI